MYKLFLLLISILMASASLAQNKTTAPEKKETGPKIKFKAASHDFGKIVEGKYAKHTFIFYNEGDKPLLLKNVRPTCGCTASKWTREPVMPGDSGIVTAVFNSRGYGGRTFHKSITVTTNQKQSPVKVLYIKGYVKKKQMPKKEPQSPVRIDNS